MFLGMKNPHLEQRVPQFKLFKDLIAPVVGTVTGMKGLTALPGSAANPYPAAPMPTPAPQTFLPAALPGGAYPAGSVIPDYGPIGGTASGMGMARPAGFPAILGGAARLVPGASRLLGAAAGIVRTAAGKVRGVMTSAGRFVSSTKAAALAKKVGLETAAVALGVSAVELAEMVLADQEQRGRRRSRGVSGTDLKRTRRTIRTIERMHQQIVSACRPAMPRRTFSRPVAKSCPPVRLVKVK